MDIVYPLKNMTEDDYVELRYSLRSLKNIEHDRVIIVGGKPDWVKNIIHIDEYDVHSLKGSNSLRKILTTFSIVSDDFIYMNDDFFMLKPQKVKYFHQGNFRENVEHKAPLLNYSRYWQGMHRTAILFDEPLDYEVHYPFVFNKNKFLEMLKKYDMTKAYALRSLYGNEYKVGGEYVKDNKVYNLDDFRNAFKTDYFVSSSDQLPVDDAFIKILDNFFPDKSPYEK
jgi:hypothetical protein